MGIVQIGTTTDLEKAMFKRKDERHERHAHVKRLMQRLDNKLTVRLWVTGKHNWQLALYRLSIIFPYIHVIITSQYNNIIGNWQLALYRFSPIRCSIVQTRPTFIILAAN